MAKLSDNTLHNLSEVMTSEVIEYIEQDSRYCDFLQELIPDALEYKMGKLDDDLKFELSIMIMDSITLSKLK